MSNQIDEAITWLLYATCGLTALNFFASGLCQRHLDTCRELLQTFQNAIEIDITQQNASKALSEITKPTLVSVTGYLVSRVKDGEINYLNHGDNEVNVVCKALAIEDIHYSKRNGKILDDINKFIIYSIRIAPMLLSSHGNSKTMVGTKANEVISLHLSDINVSKELQDQVMSELLPRFSEIPASVRKKLSHVKPSNGLDYVASKTVHHGSFIRSKEFDLPRKAHTYDDYWSNSYKKAIQYIVPAFLNCSIIGNLSLDSDGTFCLSPHPLLGLIMFRSVHFPDLVKYYEESILGYISAVEMYKKITIYGLAATGVVGIAYIYRYFMKPRSHVVGNDGPNSPSTAPNSPSAAQNSECPICLESTMINHVALVPCGHCYCKACIDQHIAVGPRNNASCPLCKIAIQTTLKIFL